MINLTIQDYKEQIKSLEEQQDDIIFNFKVTPNKYEKLKILDACIETLLKRIEYLEETGETQFEENIRLKLQEDLKKDLGEIK